jgi:hypothetical protein
LARLRNPRAVVTDNNGYVINFRLEWFRSQ